MSRATATDRAPDTAWGAETLRLTIFHSPGQDVRADGWWEQVVGEPPDSSVNKAKSGERVEIGTADGAQLVLHTQRVGRIDWVMQATDLPEQPAPSLPEAAQSFVNRMATFLRRPDIPTVNRMAFGAVALLTVADAEQGYRKLSDYLPFDLDRKGSRDFLYQINRRRTSEVAGIDVNRLSKWSVGLLNRASLAVSGEGLVAVTNPEVMLTSCRIELDINTVPEGTPEFPGEKLVPLMMELFAMAREIVREGDIP